ncbi:hypothetical protein ZHAS_00015293 [Anopheles sinensis]|uniref:Uncharacterized protein n=1 Tax=Anopheles sinensis TaxID=74873 RepID=A0A084WAM2_ANOSI|nr:hypothetical protein ZHAS_00015293 [Anopheles sinensis]
MGFTKHARLGSARTPFANGHDLVGIRKPRPTRIAICWVGIAVLAVVGSLCEGVDAQGLVVVEPERNDTAEYYHLEMGASGEVKEREMLELRQKLAGKTLRVTTLQTTEIS